MTNTFSYKNFGLSTSSKVPLAIRYLIAVMLLHKIRYGQYESVKNYWVSEEQPGDGESPRPNNLPTGGVRENPRLDIWIMVLI